MDELFLGVFRRRADAGLQHLVDALASHTSLRTIWESRPSVSGAVFRIEFVALANQRKAIRTEVLRYANRIRQIQLYAITRALADAGISPEMCPPVAALLEMTGIAQVIDLERALGVTEGHDETIAFVDRLIARFEHESPQVPRRARVAGPEHKSADPHVDASP